VFKLSLRRIRQADRQIGKIGMSWTNSPIIKNTATVCHAGGQVEKSIDPFGHQSWNYYNACGKSAPNSPKVRRNKPFMGDQVMLTVTSFTESVHVPVRSRILTGPCLTTKMMGYSTKFSRSNASQATLCMSYMS
jgi:hypothetical protein